MFFICDFSNIIAGPRLIIMTLVKKAVSLLELKRLLHELKDSQNTCIRVRLIGQLWQQSFMRVSVISDSGVVLCNENTGGFINIPQLSTILQFEIDHSFKIFQPHFHYDVVTREEN